ncbi:putative TMhelix containing protein IV [Vibrio phage VPMCC14]|nr:putative TMhelix containing protein IV [Vibrio phage VPMCC14]
MKQSNKKRDKVKQKLREFKETRGVESLFLLIFCAMLALYAKDVDAGECKFIKNLNDYQRDVARKAYLSGEPHNLGLTAVAVAYKESRLGLFKVRYNSNNTKDQSFGVMHTVGFWKVRDLSPFKAGEYIHRLIQSDDFSIKVGVEDILYWQKQAKGNWSKGVAMYNGGFKPNYNYSKRITTIVKQIKNCKF